MSDTPDPTEGRKFDAGKADWTLIPWDGLDAVRRVLEFGAKKYAPENWRHVPDSTARYTKAALRHMFTAITQPGSVDEETGESHWAHAVCCGLFILGKRTHP